MRELTGFRGRTFSSTNSWIDGGPAYAFKKLEEVRAMLLEEAVSEESKRRRRCDWQRVYDFQDAASTISDAIHYIDPEGALRGREGPPKDLARLREEIARAPLGS